MRKLALNDEILLKIEKPARYIGNEMNGHERPGKGRCPVCHVFSRMCTKSECPILASRSFMICSTAARMCGVSVSIPRGQDLDQ